MTSAIYRPSISSLAFRANLAQLISPLRRVRPRVPFFQIPAHRVPTLWSLYRGLLRNAPTENIAFRVQMLFRKYRHLTGTSQTKARLLQGYKWLETFTKARNGDEHLRSVLERYSRIIEARRKKAYWANLVQKELEWIHRLRNRPILTGGYIRPSYANPPLPRMKPQPAAIGHMIASRRKAHERRIVKLSEVEEALNDLRIERDFEDGLGRLSDGSFPPVFGGAEFSGWAAPFEDMKRAMNKAFAREQARASMPISPELLATLRRARHEKIVNKTRERERERRGEILKRTFKRARKGPPAHVLSLMSEQQKKEDKIVRSVSEVGYVAQIKRKKGFKLKDPTLWKKELSLEKRSILDKMAHEIRVENEKRRSAVEKELDALHQLPML